MKAAVAGNRRDRLREMLADLKMPGALEAVDGILSGADSGAVSAAEAIEQLLDAQIGLRNNRRLQAAMRSSRLPAVKTLGQFDFAFQPSIKREQIESLHELGFVDRAENVILLGPPGVGKTHLAISLAITAAQAGRRVYYGTLAGLIESLMEAKTAGDLSRRLRVLTHPALLVVDEIGYLPVTQDGAVLFFQLINARHERASTVLTSNKGFEEWGSVLGDEVMAAALIDRLLHHCHIVNIRGNSYRMREHQNLMRPAVRATPRGGGAVMAVSPQGWNHSAGTAVRHPDLDQGRRLRDRSRLAVLDARTRQLGRPRQAAALIGVGAVSSLKAAGKARKVAITALMRKLIVLCERPAAGSTPVLTRGQSHDRRRGTGRRNPVATRSTAMALSPAEKQRRYRERLKAGVHPVRYRKPRGPALPSPALARCRGRTPRTEGSLRHLPRQPPRRPAGHRLRRTSAGYRRSRHRGA